MEKRNNTTNKVRNTKRYTRIPRYTVIGAQVTRNSIQYGCNLVAKAVAHTLSPKGTNSMIITEDGKPIITNDGATIANYVIAGDTVTNAGCSLVKEISARSNKYAGDGTTTTILLASQLVNNLMNDIKKYPDEVMNISRELRKVKEYVPVWCNKVRKEISSLDEIEKIATASSNTEEIGKLIKSGYEKVGIGGLMTMSESDTMESKVEVKTGYSWNNGHLRQELITNLSTMETKLEDTYVLIYRDKITSYPQQIIPLFRSILEDNKSLLIIADDFDGMAYAPMIATRGENSIRIVGVKTPGFGARMNSLVKDIVAVTGAKVVGSMEDVKSLQDVNMSHLGKAKSVTIGLTETTLIGYEESTAIQTRVSELKEELKKATHQYDIDTLNKRIAKLENGIADIKVGAVTETEMKEKMLRVEDSIRAVKGAIEKGYYLGSGVAYIQFGLSCATEKIANSSFIARIINPSLEVISKTIMENCGESSGNIRRTLAYIKETILSGREPQVYDALETAENKLVDPYEKGIIDPITVIEQALLNALSIAEMITTVSVAVNPKGVM